MKKPLIIALAALAGIFLWKMFRDSKRDPSIKAFEDQTNSRMEASRIASDRTAAATPALLQADAIKLGFGLISTILPSPSSFKTAGGNEVSIPDRYGFWDGGMLN